MNIDIDLDIEHIKGLVYEWLQQQNDALFNSYLIVLVRDTIMETKEVFQKLTNCDIQSVADTINSLDDLMNLLEELGCADDTLAISLTDAVKSSVNLVSSSINSLMDTVESMQSAFSIDVNL